MTKQNRLYKEFVVYKEALGLINMKAFNKFNSINKKNLTLQDVADIQHELRRSKWLISEGKREDWRRLCDNT